MKLNKKAFTLVELIIVVSIIATLSSLAYISMSSETANARDKRRLTDLQTLDAAFSTANAKGADINFSSGATTGAGSGTTDADRIQTTAGAIRVLRNGKLVEVKDGLVAATILSQVAPDPRANTPYLAAFLTSSLYQVVASLENADIGVATNAIKGSYKTNAVVDNLLQNISNATASFQVGNADQFIPGVVNTGVNPNTTTGDVIQVNNEKMAITAIDKTTDTITIHRGFNTTAQIHSKRAGVKIIEFADDAQSLFCLGNLTQVASTVGGATSDDAYTCSANASILNDGKVVPYTFN
jgi:prepilin-type N-terminal cleavage/methylation domain-containing protein